ILNRLAVYIEKNLKLKRQLKGAMIYPSSVLIIFVGVLTVLLTFVIPSFKTMFKDFGAKDELPALTEMDICVSETFISNLFFILAGALCRGFFLVWGYRRPRGKKLAHRLLLRLPIIG